MKRIFIFTFLLLLAVRVVSAATVDTLAVHSPSMDRDIPVVAIVPEGVSAAEPCPVVYLLPVSYTHLTLPTTSRV